MTSHAPNSTTRCRMRHSQNFDKIDSLLKPVLNIYVLGNLIVGRGRGLIKRELVFCIKSVDSGKVLTVEGVGLVVRVSII